MRKLVLPVAIAALALLGACATATPYQAAISASSSGYSDQQIENNRFRVQFSGNSLTDRKTVETYLLYRAAELTKLNGYDNFRVVHRDTDAESRMVPIGGGAYSPFYDNFYLDYYYFGSPAYFYRRPFGPDPFWPRWGYYDPYWGPAQYRESTRYMASAEILMGKGQKPDDAAYFDADQVLMNLSGSIVRPES
nr:hypothetical protein [uncultured Hyphomonas sp.]